MSVLWFIWHLKCTNCVCIGKKPNSFSFALEIDTVYFELHLNWCSKSTFFIIFFFSNGTCIMTTQMGCVVYLSLEFSYFSKITSLMLYILINWCKQRKKNGKLKLKTKKKLKTSIWVNINYYMSERKKSYFLAWISEIEIKMKKVCKTLLIWHPRWKWKNTHKNPRRSRFKIGLWIEVSFFAPCLKILLIKKSMISYSFPLFKIERWNKNHYYTIENKNYITFKEIAKIVNIFITCYFSHGYFYIITSLYASLRASLRAVLPRS